MRAAYSSWDGAPESITGLAKQVGLSRKEFITYKRLHGWTHDMDPFLDQEILDKSIEVLTDSVIQQRRRALERRVAEKQTEWDRKDAEEWRRLKAGVYTPFKHLATHIEIEPVPLLSFPDRNDQERILVINANDWQIGEKSQSEELSRGADYSTQLAVESIKRYVERIAEHVASSRARYTRAIVTDLGDLGHGLDGFTAHGTPLEVDSYRQEQVHAILNSLKALIDAARQVTPQVDVYHVEDNHLGFGSTLIFDQIAAWYHGGSVPVKGVTVHHNYKPVEFVPVGDDTLLVLVHGEAGRPARKAIGKAGATRERDIYWLVQEGIRQYPKHRNVYVLTGHVHQRLVEEFSDFTVLTFGAAISGDRYADSLMVSGRPHQTILEINPHHGTLYPIPIPLT